MDMQIPIQSQILLLSEKCTSNIQNLEILLVLCRKEIPKGHVKSSYSYEITYISIQEGYYTAQAACKNQHFVF